MAVTYKTLMEREAMQKKRISVSSKRQITIPLQFFKELDIQSEVECYVKEGALIIKPVQGTEGGTFAVEILQDLVKEGYEGDELVARFRKINSRVRGAVESMIAEADQVGRSVTTNGTDKINEIFGAEE